ncbi:MAG: hypothetical protein QM736_13320 [Vicinamibacterales bacterium]
MVWDFGTDSGTYGVFEICCRRRDVDPDVDRRRRDRLEIESGPANQRRVLEMSSGSRNKNASGWGHMQDAKAAVAFGMPRFGRDTGTYTIALAGSGQATFRFAPTTPSTRAANRRVRTLRLDTSRDRRSHQSDSDVVAAVGDGGTVTRDGDGRWTMGDRR